ncbi:MAG: DUF2800 domain-containing protein, partial [Anaerolineaceae bacterium]|nr:DUF2800 domain-containing protein [Anaerolineaceae bacterium]
MDALAFRPSGSTTWMFCPGSPTLSKDTPDSPSEWAEAGSRQHRLAEIYLTGFVRGDSYYTPEIVQEKDNLQASMRREDFASVINYIRRTQSLVEPGDTLLIEQKVGISRTLGVPGAGGTLDFGIVRADGRAIQIVDRKFPWGKPVYAAGEGDDMPNR